MGEFATFRLIGLDYFPDKKKSPETYERLFKYELPNSDIKDLPYVEFNQEFDAVVPYKMTGWEKSRNLKEIKDIDKKLIKKMEEMQKVIKDRNGDQYIFLSQKSLADKYICSYSTPKEIAEDNSDLTAFADMNDVEDFTWVPYNNYEVVFYANGRVVSLRRHGNKANFYGPALHAKWKDDKSPAEIWFNEFYYIPEGKEELEILR